MLKFVGISPHFWRDTLAKMGLEFYPEIWICGLQVPLVDFEHIQYNPVETDVEEHNIYWQCPFSSRLHEFVESVKFGIHLKEG